MAEKEPLVSIITAAFNGASFLRIFSVPSVLQQSYKNWELIIVDDGSTDNTAEVAEQFQKADSRIRFIKHNSNKGLAAALNSGIRDAKGEFIAFLEQDDVWLSHKLEKQVEGMIRNANSICSRTLCWVADLQKKWIVNIDMAVFSGIVVRCRVFKETGFFNEDRKLSGMQDGDLMASLASKYAQNDKNYILYLNEPLVIFTRHADSLSSRPKNNSRKFIDRYAAICEKYDKTEFANDKNIKPFLYFWYSHQGFNFLFLGDGRSARKNLE